MPITLQTFGVLLAGAVLGLAARRAGRPAVPGGRLRRAARLRRGRGRAGVLRAGRPPATCSRSRWPRGWPALVVERGSRRGRGAPVAGLVGGRPGRHRGRSTRSASRCSRLRLGYSAEARSLNAASCRATRSRLAAVVVVAGAVLRAFPDLLAQADGRPRVIELDAAGVTSPRGRRDRGSSCTRSPARSPSGGSRSSAPTAPASRPSPGWSTACGRHHRPGPTLAGRRDRTARRCARASASSSPTPTPSCVMPTAVEDVALSLRRRVRRRARAGRRRARRARRGSGWPSTRPRPCTRCPAARSSCSPSRGCSPPSPRVLVCDEPTTLLDLRWRRVVDDLLDDRRRPAAAGHPRPRRGAPRRPRPGRRRRTRGARRARGRGRRRLRAQRWPPGDRGDGR